MRPNGDVLTPVPAAPGATNHSVACATVVVPMKMVIAITHDDTRLNTRDPRARGDFVTACSCWLLLEASSEIDAALEPSTLMPAVPRPRRPQQRSITTH